MFDYIRVMCTLSRRFGKRRNNMLMLTLIFMTITFLAINERINSVHMPETKTFQNSSLYKTFFPVYFNKLNTPCKILLWTPLWGSMDWYYVFKDVYKHDCPRDCIITKDKSEIVSATVVIFHLADITWQGQLTSGFSFSFPTYRHPDQIWILYNLEPWTMLWGNMAAWQGVFNWTMSYTRDADVHIPYDAYRKLSEIENETVNRDRSVLDKNFFSDKTEKGGIAMVSHCSDEAERYKVMEHVSKYIDIKIVGKCGEKCPVDFSSCNKLLPKYKFHLAFENSDCKDYVSEKYWRSLKQNIIPIVAWRTPMGGIVIPGSYINVYDFDNLDVAGSYIQKVEASETLYNSYFKWKLTYAIETPPVFCTLADKLEKTFQHMVYQDMYGWIHNNYNTCQPVTLRKLLSRKLARFLFDMRL